MMIMRVCALRLHGISDTINIVATNIPITITNNEGATQASGDSFPPFILRNRILL